MSSLLLPVMKKMCLSGNNAGKTVLVRTGDSLSCWSNGGIVFGENFLKSKISAPLKAGFRTENLENSNQKWLDASGSKKILSLLVI